MVADHANAMLWKLGVRAVDVLERVRRGPIGAEAGVTVAKAKWVTSRLAELFEWELRGGTQTAGNQSLMSAKRALSPIAAA